MAIKKTLYLGILILLIVLVMTYFMNKKRLNNREGFEGDIYYGTLPDINHPSRIRNLLYYNDPIFIEYFKKFVLLRDDDVIGERKDALKYIIYIEPTTSKKGLSPIEYNLDTLEANFAEQQTAFVKIIFKLVDVIILILLIYMYLNYYQL